MSNNLYTIEYQRQVVKLLCTNIKFAIDFGNLLKSDYFELEPLRIIYNIISKHILAYEKEMELNDLLVKVDEYVIHQGFSGDTFNILKEEAKEVFRAYIKNEQWLTDTLVSYCRRQELISAINKSIDMLEQDPENSYERVLKEIDNAVSIGSGTISEGLNFQSLVNLPELMKSRYDSSKLYKTGISRYDQACMGGFAPGEVHVIQASPKQGKSTLGANIGAYGLVSGKTVFHISLEISDIDVANKYAIRLTGMSYSEMNNITTEEYREKIKRFEKYKPKLFINFWPEGTANTLMIRSWISRMRSKYNIQPDIIILDYDDCLLPISGESKDNLYGNSGEIYKDLIGLAHYFKVPILTFAQPQREAWDLPNKFELIRSFHVAHSARKIHRLTSISSLNFADDKSDGILYVDLNRRGDSGVKIPMKKELYRGLFYQKD